MSEKLRSDSAGVSWRARRRPPLGARRHAAEGGATLLSPNPFAGVLGAFCAIRGAAMTTLADILAAIDSLKPPEPAGYATHPADVEKLRLLFGSGAKYDGASSLVNGGTFLYGIEIIPDSRVEIGRPEPLTSAEIRGRRER